jgi:AbrB family looped-hinge helix DNA binding protein
MVKCGVVGWSRITRNGQVTLPKEIREKLGLTPGKDLIQFLLTERDHVLIRRFTLSESIEV